MTKPRLTAGYKAIIAFKFAKLAGFLLLGLAALKIARLPPDWSEHEAMKLVGAHHTEPLLRYVASAMSVLTPHQIEALGGAAILLALVFGAEGTLLALRVWWAPYLSVVLTAMGLPFELAEIARRPESLRRYLLLAVNAAILVYLWRRKDEFRPEGREPPPAR